MASLRSSISLVVAVGLAAAIHVDWHFARHHGGLSLSWPYHWLFAIPTFALAAWYLRRRRPARLLPASVASIAAAAVLAQGIEPLGELVLYDWPLAESFGPERVGAFAAFMTVGLITYIATLAALGWPSTGSVAPPPTA